MRSWIPWQHARGTRVATLSLPRELVRDGGRRSSGRRFRARAAPFSQTLPTPPGPFPARKHATAPPQLQCLQTSAWCQRDSQHPAASTLSRMTAANTVSSMLPPSPERAPVPANKAATPTTLLRSRRGRLSMQTVERKLVIAAGGRSERGELSGRKVGHRGGVCCRWAMLLHPSWCRASASPLGSQGMQSAATLARLHVVKCFRARQECSPHKCRLLRPFQALNGGAGSRGPSPGQCCGNRRRRVVQPRRPLPRPSRNVLCNTPMPCCRAASSRGLNISASAGHTAPQSQSLARSLRPIPITVVTVAKGSSKGAELMALEWADKLKRWVLPAV